ncbi:nucleotide pyrophosphatase, partial [Bordetella holmesii]|nr:nucleotide pyrophosphatase [Bordetella holmesii]
LRFSRRRVATGSVNFGQLEGSLGPDIGLNDDGVGTSGVCCAGTKGPSTMYFDDLGILSRSLTEA